jgi:rhamnulokinase
VVHDKVVSVAAVDLGASSGRVFLFTLQDDALSYRSVARFPNKGVQHGSHFVWEFTRLYDEILQGIGEASSIALENKSPLQSVGVDSWAVDYGLISLDGELIDNPVHHRDPRTEDAVKNAALVIDPWELYQRNGVALLQFNTLFQLVADGPKLRDLNVHKMMMIPDLIDYFLCGEATWEITNASTTEMLSQARNWDFELMDMFDIPASIVGGLTEPGLILGPITENIARNSAITSGTQVISVASHDTASAVLAIPAEDSDFAFISSGTWSLVGVELDEPLINEHAFRAGYTNELGAFGKIRFLRNVLGFWLLQEVIREFGVEGEDTDAETLTAAAASIAPLRFLVNAESKELLTPGDMRGRLAAQCEQLGLAAPITAPEFTRCILDSLALSYRHSIRGIQSITKKNVNTIHIVGGGAMNDTLCQLTADACGIPVVAGPVEAAAIGNALMQLQALGAVGQDLWSMRKLVASSFPTRRFEPDVSRSSMWDDAEKRVALIETPAL